MPISEVIKLLTLRLSLRGAVCIVKEALLLHEESLDRSPSTAGTGILRPRLLPEEASADESGKLNRCLLASFDAILRMSLSWDVH